MNENDSLLISGLLQSAGHTRVQAPEQARIIIINTCCVRESAENRAFGHIGALKKLHSDDPRRIIIVCGCMAQKEGTAKRLLESYRHVGIIVGSFALARLPEYIEQYAAGGKCIVDTDERYDGAELKRLPGGMIDENEWRAQVNINYGCNNFCSYCIVPYVRGRERSRAVEDIVGEIELLAAGGVREIQLLGQNVNAYGHDLRGQNLDFAALLKRVAAIDGLLRIRYMTSHPRDFDRRLAETIAALPNVCRHFHLPVQSGCDRQLKMMNRGYTAEEYLLKLDMIRELFADATITTDIITGFPGETEADFRATLDFVAAARFDAAYTFIYSRRSGTPAADFPDQLPEQEKRERLQRLLALQNPISLERNRQLIGRILPVMTEGISKNNDGFFQGRSDGNKIVIFPREDDLRAGELVDLRISAAHTWNLRAERVLPRRGR